MTAAPDTDTMFSAREVPWMKLGKLVDEPVTAMAAAEMGGINFTVSQQPVYFSVKKEGAPPKFTKVEGRKAIVRDDTGDWLSIVSKSYPVVQYGEAFDFMDTVSPHFVAAGGLRGGRQAFMVVRTPTGSFDPLGDDPHEMFATLRTSHDCSRAVEVMVMPLRQRCMNQLTLASFRKGVEHRWTVTHTGDVKSKLAAVNESMTRLTEYAAIYTDNVQRLVKTMVDTENATQILTRVLPDRPRRAETIGKILINWQSRTETVGYAGTGWGLVNAVSEYFEWDRTGGSSESRFLAALQGQTHRAINKVTGQLLSRA
jgi:phage/plasmid-like protein (TIGR03299 family)